MTEDPDDDEEYGGVMCAFCFESAADIQHLTELSLTWPGTNMRMRLYAHGSCLRSAIHPGVPLPEPEGKGG